MRGRKPHVKLGTQCQVKAYIPPQHLVRIADDRTSGMMMFFIRSGSHWQNLSRLVRSAYMQGVHDMITAQESLHEQGYRLERQQPSEAPKEKS